MKQSVDVAVVGGGILGLAFAWEATRRGKSVAVFERDARAQGASIRNFGMIWPIGQPRGELYDTALLSRERWLELGRENVLWVNPCGSVHVAYESDEASVLQEYSSLYSDSCTFWTASDAIRKMPCLENRNLRGALHSSTELAVDPRQAIENLPRWLAEKHGVRFHFETAVVDAKTNRLRTARGDDWHAGRIFIASGIDFETLFPEVYRTAGLRKCKLQMLRTPPQPKDWQLGHHLAGGLTLAHYKSFEACNTLSQLKTRIAQTMPEYVRYGIHVMASQNELGEVIIGDSHEYDADISIFNNERIDELILQYLATMIALPNPAIASRWHGFYAKHPTKSLLIESPLDGVTIVAAPGGAGMTMSFGFARNWWDAQ